MPPEVQRIRARLGVIALFMVLWGTAIGARLYFLQIVQSADFRERAENQHERVIEIMPRRGEIYDRNGKPLAVSVEVDSLFAVPTEVDDPQGTAAFLAQALDMDAGVITSRLSGRGSFAWIRRKITQRQSEIIRDADIDGLYFQTESQRFYPNRELASHVLGFVNLDNEGGGGLEYRYNDLIAGTGGKVVVMKDARGRRFQSLDQLPTTGASLTTTIDQNIQYIVEREMATAIAETDPLGMSVVVMDPASGEILAMANYPDYNPNEYGDYAPETWSNRAVSHVYEPGSTFKIVTAAAALEEQLTHLDELIDCQMGHVFVNGQRFNDHAPYGILTVREILQVSSNVGIIKLGQRLGDERLADYITRMGFGVKTGVDLPGEQRGLFRPAEEWSRVSVGAISMGQEIAATPLQVVSMVAAVANGGTWYRPHVVRKIEDPRTGQVTTIEPEGSRVISASTADDLHDALEAVITDGTARNARMDFYTAAAKTGTAQKYDPATGTYSLTKHVASIAGYAPATRPELAVIVAIDEPSGAMYYGGQVASPVFKRIVEEVLRYRSVPPDVPAPVDADVLESNGTVPAPETGMPAGPVRSNDAPSSVPSRPAPADVESDWEVVDVALEPETPETVDPAIGLPLPDFRGRSLREVTGDCLRLGLRCQSNGSGTAIAQSVVPGTPVPRGGRVQIRFSTRTGGSVNN